MTRLNLVTYNIRKGKGIRGSRPGLEEISKSLASLELDLLLCQEVFHHHDGGGIHQSRDVAHALDLVHRYEPNSAYRRGHHGNTTFSKFPISRHSNRDISTNRVERRGILYTRVYPVHGAPLHVFNTHFGLSQRQRMSQAAAMCAWLRELDPADPVVLAGDFNDWSGRIDPVLCSEGELDNAMLKLAMTDRRTWSTRRPLFSLDRIYYRNLHLVEVRVLRTSPWDRLSDHFPVLAVLEIKPAPGPEAR